MKNNIRYKGNTNNTSVIIFFNRGPTQQKLRAMILCLGEPPGRFFVVAVHSFLFFILLLFFISFPGYFTMSLALHPWHLKLVKTSTKLWALPRLLLIAFCFFICRERYGFEWGFFFPLAFFTLRSFIDIFLRLTRPPWEPAVLPWSLHAGVHTDDPRSTDPVHLFVWFTVIHNLHIQKNSFLNSTIYYHELLVIKSLVYMLLTRFELFSLVQSHM